MRVFAGSFEIPARDLARAREFYRQAFGWEARPVRWEGPAYFALGPSRADSGAAGTLRGGLGDPVTVGAEHPLLVLHVEGGALEDCLERVVAAGGSILEEPRAVGGLGRFARVRDPEGNPLGLWSAAPAQR